MLNIVFTLAVFISLHLAGLFMRLEITNCDLERPSACRGFSQQIFSFGKRICGFAWGKNGGRNKLLKLSLSPAMMASQLQIHVACRDGKVDQALSLGFLLCWIAGDLTNLIGCYLTNQLPIQTVTAISYVNMDIVLISQFVYYKLKNQKMKGSGRLKNFCIVWILMCITLCIVLPCQLLIRKQEQSSAMRRSNNSLDMTEMSGFVCGYISCVFYLGSRFPQLYKNFQRKSTEGSSYLLFALAMLGNCTYGLSLVLRMPAAESVPALYFLHHLPWLLGSFGVLFLDVFVTVQFLLYGQHKERPRALVALEVEPLLVGEEDA
ncbi:lysosomal amino acid transporter 1 homolog isoform X4 [Excalfactoria chinensis]|uniref:lysosomal amino acid transporter 1 homolog isoform X4 n=1 Tax=Excalfactoria chinensis TaxID=46218 RepID=UPI003B3A4A66